MITAFTLPLRAFSHLDADLQVAARGISIARQHNPSIWIEMDSAQTVTLLQGGELGPAATRHKVARIRTMSRGLNLWFSFIHREGNKSAGELAKRGITSTSEEILDETTCPNLIRAMVRLERLVVPNLRCVQIDSG